MSDNYRADRFLPSELAHYKALRERLLSEVPGIDDETLADTLEGISDLREMLMKARLDRFKTRAIRKRDVALKIMVEAEFARLLVPDFTASLRKGTPALDIISEVSIPPEYWKPQPAKLDRQALIANLKSGRTIGGALLIPAPPQLTVRTK